MALGLRTQKGMALLVSLIFLMLLSLLGLGALENAGQQEKMAGSVRLAHQSFQVAESALRIGESWLHMQWADMAECVSMAHCAPPSEVKTRLSPGIDPQSGVNWVRVADGLYGIQFLGRSSEALASSAGGSTHLYRVSGIGLRGQSRTVLETIYARYQTSDEGVGMPARQSFRRSMWRQIQ